MPLLGCCISLKIIIKKKLVVLEVVDMRHLLLIVKAYAGWSMGTKDILMIRKWPKEQG